MGNFYQFSTQTNWEKVIERSFLPIQNWRIMNMGNSNKCRWISERRQVISICEDYPSNKQEQKWRIQRLQICSSMPNWREKRWIGIVAVVWWCWMLRGSIGEKWSDVHSDNLVVSPHFAKSSPAGAVMQHITAILYCNAI